MVFSTPSANVFVLNNIIYFLADFRVTCICFKGPRVDNVASLRVAKTTWAKELTSSKQF